MLDDTQARTIILPNMTQQGSQRRSKYKKRESATRDAHP